MGIFKSLKPKADLSLNPFDRSRSETFSLKLGQLVPCFVEHTIPKGKYRINVGDIVRVDSQVTANFVGMTQNIEFFFVPYSQLWHPFNRWYYGRGEETRSFSANYQQQNPALNSALPNIDLQDLLYFITLAIGRYRCFEALIEAYRFPADSENYPQVRTLPAEILTWAKNKGIIAGTDWRTQPHVDIHGRFCGYDQLRILDMLGYGNFWPILKYAISQVSMPSVSYPYSDGTTAFENYASSLWSYVSVMTRSDEYVNPFAIMAYIKVFSDWYRNTQYDNWNYEYYYNCDWSLGGNAPWSSSVLCLGLKPFYRQYKKDMFTGGYPNPQFGSAALASLEPDATISASSSATVPSGNAGVYLHGTGNTPVGVAAGNLYAQTSNIDHFDINTGVSAVAIRQALALQKYRETIMRAGTREKDLQRAVFGVGSHYIEDSYSHMIGSFSSVLQSNPVAATTVQGEQSLGDLGAYSVGAISLGSQKELSFDANDFGIIIGVLYIMPTTKYDAYGIDPQNVKFVSDDFYKPAFANLGLSPVYNYYANSFGLEMTSPDDRVLGYLARYYEYKTAVSRVHGEFFGYNPCIADDKSNYGGSYVVSSDNAFSGAFSCFVAPRNVNDVAWGALASLYIAPWDCDRIFNVSDGLLLAQDHFKVEASFEVKAVLPMSVIGLPS